MKAIEARQPSLRELEQASRDWLESIQPLIKRKAELMGFAQPRIIMSADGGVEKTEFVLTEEQQKLMAQADELIGQMKPAILKSQ